MKRTCAVLLSLGLLVLSGQTFPAAEPFRFPPARHGTGELKFVQGLPVLVLSGTPEEIGDAAGRLAVAPGKRTLEFPHDLLKRYKVDGLWNFLSRTGEGMVKAFPAAY